MYSLEHEIQAQIISIYASAGNVIELKALND
jgi:hypothetical protein